MTLGENCFLRVKGNFHSLKKNVYSFETQNNYYNSHTHTQVLLLSFNKRGFLLHIVLSSINRKKITMSAISIVLVKLWVILLFSIYSSISVLFLISFLVRI